METQTQEIHILGNILLIEDTEIPMKLYQRILEKASIKVYQARSLQEAEEKLQKHSEDLDAIVSDIYLESKKEGEGEDNLNDVLDLATKYAPRIEVIAMSANKDAELPAAEKGCNFFDKEKKPSLLLAMIRNTLYRRLAERERNATVETRKIRENNINILQRQRDACFSAGCDDKAQAECSTVQKIHSNVATYGEQVQQQNREIEIAAKQRHDSRNELQVVLGSSQITQHQMAEIVLGLEEMQKNLDPTVIPELLMRCNKIKKTIGTSEKAAKFLERILNPSEYGMTKQSINEIIEDVLEKMDARNVQLSIEREYDQSIPPMFCNGDELARALMNSLQNAYQALEESGYDERKVKITTRKIYDKNKIEGLDTNIEYICVEIEDNGPGIPQEVLESLYDNSKDRSITTKKEGQGMGTKQIREAIEKRHSGKVQISTRTSGPSTGTTMQYFLPIIDRKTIHLLK